MNLKQTLMALFAAIIICSCASEDQPVKKRATRVKITSAQKYNAAISSQFIGKVVSSDEASVSFKLSGTILDIPIKVGQQVRKGEIIATLDSRDYTTQLSATQADYKQIKAEAERIIELFKRNSTTESNYDKAVSGLNQITAKLKAHKDIVNDCVLKAPISGTIAKIIYNAGENINAGMPIIKILNSDNFEVEIFTPAKVYRQIRGRHSCVIPQLSNDNIGLNFISTSPNSTASGLYSTTYKIDSKTKDLLSGMNAIVTINNNNNVNEELVTVPISSIFEKNSGTYVWVYNDTSSRVKAQKVITEKLLNDGRVIISSGVKAGEIVVTAGIHSINEDMTVKPLDEISSTNIGGVI